MNNDKKTENMVAVATEKATEKAVAKTEKTAAVKKAEKPKAEKLLTMSQIKTAARAAGVTFVRCKNTAGSYIIFDGKTSLHIKKSSYRLFATTADFEIVKCLTLINTQLIENGNAVDKVRPHTINVNCNADLKWILAAIAVNNRIELK